MNIRHSALPKLALCGQYQGAPGTSPAAERGTKLDAAFRHAWVHGEFPDWDLPEEDAEAVRWAINQCISIGGARDGLTTDEDRCRILTGGIGAPAPHWAMGGWGFALHCAILPQSSRPAP